MSLATRLSIFFLGMLAVVLVCFSTALWIAQRWTLMNQADEQLTAALRTLVASIEIEPEGVEWNPAEHRFSAFDSGPDAVLWRVTDDLGNIVDETSGFQNTWTLPSGRREGEIETVSHADGEPWRIAHDRVFVPPEIAKLDDESSQSPPGPDDVPEYPALTVTVALPIGANGAALERLAMLLFVLGLAIWGLAAAAGHWLVRRALQPVTTMAAAAGSLQAAGLSRLPVSRTGDELEELGEAFNALLDRLNREFARERRFSAEVSHQLRTPVTAMLGQVDVALRRERSPEAYRETLHEVRTQAARLREIVESLLSLARSESIAASSMRPIVLDKWLTAQREDWSDHDRAADLRLETSTDDTLVVETDPDLLAQVLGILIDNALKYGPPDTPVVLRSTAEADSVTVDVIDAGPGPSEEEAAAVFRPFHRGAKAIDSGTPGVGLGLALAQRIAERLGAKLTFDRTDDGRSRFQIRIPREGAESVRRIEAKVAVTA